MGGRGGINRFVITLLFGRDLFAFPLAFFPLDMMFFCLVFSKLVCPSCNRFICVNVF